MRLPLRSLQLIAALVVLLPQYGLSAPIISGTIFMDPDIITASDASTLTGLSYAGTGDRVMFDRRTNAFGFYTPHLFNASFADGLSTEIQVNPEFGSASAALAEATKYGAVIGQLPTALRVDVDTVWIHKGLELFGGGNNNILIHTGQADLYSADGILEEALVHEASHTSLDATHATAPGWLAAQALDADFISTYASEFPTREDIAESFLPYIAVRHRSDRISPALGDAILTTIPNRLSYFDDQAFNMFPLVSTSPVPEPATLLITACGLALLVIRKVARS
jgi:hypothetical protein